MDKTSRMAVDEPMTLAREADRILYASFIPDAVVVDIERSVADLEIIASNSGSTSRKLPVVVIKL